MSTFVNFNIIDEKFFLWLSFEIHLNLSIFKLEWNVAFILFSVLIVFFSHFSLWLRMLFTRISYIITTMIWRFRFALSQMSFVQSSSFLNILRDFSLLILSTMISLKWHRVVSIFFRELCFFSISRVFLTISFDFIFCVNWIFFCSITLIAIFNSFLSRTEGRIWSSLVHTSYSDRVVDCCWLDRCFSCKLLNISTHYLFWHNMSLSLVIHEYLNLRAIHNEILFLSFSWLVLYLQFIVLVSNFSLLLSFNFSF